MKIIFYLLLEKYHRFVFDTLCDQNHKCNWFEKKILLKIHGLTIKVKFRQGLRRLTDEYRKKKPNTIKEFIIKKYIANDGFLRYSN